MAGEYIEFGTKQKPKVDMKTGNCVQCKKHVPEFFLIWKTDQDTFAVCKECTSTFGDNSSWEIEPMKSPLSGQPDMITCFEDGVKHYNGKCYECNVNPVDFISATKNGNKYGNCADCIKKYSFDTDPFWTVTPAHKVAVKQKPMAEVDLTVPEFCEYCGPDKEPEYKCVSTEHKEGLIRFLCKDCVKTSGWTKTCVKTPLNPSDDMKQKPVKTDMNTINGFCYMCEKNNPDFVITYKSDGFKYGVCDPCADKYGHKNSTMWTVTPIGEPVKLLCKIAKTEEEFPGIAAGGFKDWGECSGDAEFLCINNLNGKNEVKFTDKVNYSTPGPTPACSKHFKIWKNAGWLTMPISGVEPLTESPDNGQIPVIPSFAKAKEHMNSADNNWFCEQDNYIGFDGTTNHFGNCYQLYPDKKENYACDNHAGKLVNEGCLVKSYGPNKNRIYVDPHGIPDCLKPYIQDYTIEDCWFKKYDKNSTEWNTGTGSTVKAGECKGQQAGWMSGDTPVCAKHWAFATEMNKTINFATLQPLESPLSGQIKTKPVKTKADKVASGYTCRTQKARGLQALKDTYFPVPGFKIYDVKGISPDLIVGKFVRPCPMRPRHGFVDSRTVLDREDAEKIIAETLAADPEAEFLLMDYVPAQYSGIWTPGYLAIGLGTDGATTGKTAVTIPVMGDFLQRGGYGSTAKSKADIKNAPYVEILWQKQYKDYKSMTVQLRDGPKLPEGADDYIPAEFKVANVILADGDLLEWEEKMRQVPENSVVYHPNGTMASHYAIHAVLNKVPLVITREPKIGEILKPSENGPGEVNIDLIRAGFAIALEMEINMTEAAYFMLLGCHQTTQWLGKFDILLGASMGFSYRLAMTAALGEARHYDSSKGHKAKRDTVYTKVWNKADSQYGRTKFLEALELFLNGHLWPGSNYGGKAWFVFTSQAVTMYNALIKKDHKSAMEAMNQLIHAAHNSGWGFNKFIEQSEMTKTANNPIYAGFGVGPYMYEVLTAENDKVKSAARSFWKRKELPLPEDKGTGMGKGKSISAPEPDYDSDHEEECTDEDCNICHPHQYSSECDCPNCKTKTWAMSGGKKQTVTEAQMKVIPGKNKHICHIQYKSASCPEGKYYTKDITCPETLVKIYENLGADVKLSYAGSETKYLNLFVHAGGWGLYGYNGGWCPLLPLEVTPNAS